MPIYRRECIRVMIVDDEDRERDFLVHALDLMGSDVELIGQATDGYDAISMAVNLHPDIILMDYEMEGMNGIQAMRHIHEENPRIGIIFVTKYADNDDIILGALRAGARGYLAKPPNVDEVAHAIHIVYGGEAIFSPGVARKLLNIFSNHRPAEISKAFPSLTPREQEVLSLIARGDTDAKIIKELTISENTLRIHRSSIYAKLEVHDRATLILTVLRETGNHLRRCPNCDFEF